MSDTAQQLPWFDLQQADFSLAQNEIIKHEIIQRYNVFPLSLTQNRLLLGIARSSNTNALSLIAFQTGFTIDLAQIDEADLTKAIQTYCRSNILYHQLESTLAKLPPLQEDTPPVTMADPTDEPVANYLNHLFTEAISNQVSDIHIEPQSDQCRIRFRRQGLLFEAAIIPSHLATRLVTRLKILAGLNIAEKRLPQDGHLQLKQHHKLDVRLNTCPTLYGEKAALRLLDTCTLTLGINTLGMTTDQQYLFTHRLSQPQGLILVTGPTGSGKTVTLYSALHQLNAVTRHIVTVEDPVEIELNGINQVSVNPRIGLDFATILRTLLRQDPDVLMIGEIRDYETASIALQAAQTGHLVLATLHANNTMESLTRLHAIGIDTHQLTSSLSLVIAQRLIRILCQHCKQQDTATDSYLPASCPQCHEGYNGRTGIFECLSTTNKTPATLTPDSLTLHAAALEKVRLGMTSHSEINRVLGT